MTNGLTLLNLTTLKKRADFLRIAAERNRAVRPGFILQAAPRPGSAEDSDHIRIGFTASRKVGNAVKRNRAKRRLRAASAQLVSLFGRPDTDYVLIARGETGSRPFAELLGDLRTALGQVHRPRRRRDEGRPQRRGES